MVGGFVLLLNVTQVCDPLWKRLLMAMLIYAQLLVRWKGLAETRSRPFVKDIGERHSTID